MLKFERFFVWKQPWPEGVWQEEIPGTGNGNKMQGVQVRFLFGSYTNYTEIHNGDYIVTSEGGDKKVYNPKDFEQFGMRDF